MTRYEQIQAELRGSPKTWLITGVAGFIGSNILETLLKLGQYVVGLDNFSTSNQSNLDEVKGLVSLAQWDNFRFVEGDIRNLGNCREVCSGVDFVLHQAALGSVPRSISDPLATNDVNICGFLNMLVAARDAKVSGFVYAASSSTYGDHPGLPKLEENIGRLLSPYAVTKYVNELYADVFGRSYNFCSIGLRYFNVFGPRQDPKSTYAAVIPKWTDQLLRGERVYINGDGETSRDFCHIDDVVQANLLAATTINSAAINQVYNVAVGRKASLNDLFFALRRALSLHGVSQEVKPCYRDFRMGDVRHSEADVSKAENFLGYRPTRSLAEGLAETVEWYVRYKA